MTGSRQPTKNQRKRAIAMNFLQGFQALSAMQPAPPAQGLDCGVDMGSSPATISAPVSCSLIQDTYQGSAGSASQGNGCCCMTSNNLLDWGTGVGGLSEGIVA